jgi:hypothetical protein
MLGNGKIKILIHFKRVFIYFINIAEFSYILWEKQNPLKIENQHSVMKRGRSLEFNLILE